MTMLSHLTARDRAEAAHSAVLHQTLCNGASLLIVDSPPGAGKTYLIESVVAVAVQHLGLRVAAVAPRAEQTYDLARRLIGSFDPMPIQMLLAAGRTLPSDLVQSGRITQVTSDTRTLLPGAGVTISTVDKLLFAVAQQPALFDLLICDEAYQVTFAALAPLFELAPRALLVGDPGQLPPLVTVDIEPFEAARYRMHWAAPRELLRRLPQTPVVQLPASRRLPQDTIELVQPAFYSHLPFASAAGLMERRLRLSTAGTGDAIDRALDLLGARATLVGVLLPPADLAPDEVDEEVAAVMAEISVRLLDRQATWDGVRQLTASDIGGIDTRVASGAAVRRALRLRGVSADMCKVDTPEIWQGQERPLIVVKHPLSGQGRIDSFALEPGRWCVMLSRHQLGCVIVGRDGIGETLAAHRHDCGARALGGANTEWNGWQAHRTIWERLEQEGRLIRM
jgi:AAA domain